MHLSLKEFLAMKEEDPLTEFSGLVFFGESSSDCSHSMLSTDTSNSTLDYQSLINDDMDTEDVSTIIEDLQNMYNQCVGSDSSNDLQLANTTDSNDVFTGVNNSQELPFFQAHNDSKIHDNEISFANINFEASNLKNIHNSPCINKTNLKETPCSSDVSMDYSLSPEIDWASTSKPSSPQGTPSQEDVSEVKTRKRNNEASRKSRLIRRKKECEILDERERLRKENEDLKAMLKKLKSEMN